MMEYHLIGNGDINRLKEIAETAGVSSQVIFHGAIPHSKVLDFFDDIDVYVQPSKQEGLPRALVEAMSRGCLCVGSRIAGIPELLEPEYLFKKGSVNEIINILRKVTPESLVSQAKRNFDKAKEYDVNVLNNRRTKFISEFRDSFMS